MASACPGHHTCCIVQYSTSLSDGSGLMMGRLSYRASGSHQGQAKLCCDKRLTDIWIPNDIRETNASDEFALVLCFSLCCSSTLAFAFRPPLSGSFSLFLARSLFNSLFVLVWRRFVDQNPRRRLRHSGHWPCAADRQMQLKRLVCASASRLSHSHVSIESEWRLRLAPPSGRCRTTVFGYR
ncbi:hypothetical protein J3F84DRAFT_371827 [Trichoderma pleuroticola]